MISEQHAYLAPSGAALWVPCALAPSMAAQFPQPPDPAAKEGSAAHERAKVELPYTVRGLVHPNPPQIINDVEMTDEILDSVAVYIDDVRQEMISRGVFTLSVEQRIMIHMVHVMCEGTYDAALLDMLRGELILWDYKHGFEPVDAFENWQLVLYAIGLLFHIFKDDAFSLRNQDFKVRMRIVQPRAFHPDGAIREWVLSAVDFRPLFNILRAAADAATGPNPTAKTGPHCWHCPGRLGCQAFRRAVYTSLDFIGSSTVENLTPNQMGYEFEMLTRAIEYAERRADIIEQQLTEFIKRGVQVDTHQLEPTQGRLKWMLPPQDVIAFGDALGVNLRKPTEPKTPTQAKSLLDPEMISQLAEKPRTGLKLVRTNFKLARKVFAK